MADVAADACRKAEGKTTSVISPLALEAVRRIDALFEIERTINGESAERRRAVRHNQRSIGDPKASSIGSSSGTVRSERWP